MTEKEIRAILGGNLKKYRNYRNFTQEELAEKLEISIPFLSDIENSRKWISPATLVKLAGVLNIEPHKLLEPEQPLTPAVTIVLDKWSEEVIDAVTASVKNIKEYYLAQINTENTGNN